MPQWRAALDQATRTGQTLATVETGLLGAGASRCW